MGFVQHLMMMFAVGTVKLAENASLDVSFRDFHLKKDSGPVWAR